MKIKKYKVFTLFVLALLMASLVFVQVSVEQPDVAYIDPPIIYTNVSENFTVTVIANVTFEIWIFELQLNFDPTQMSVVNVTFVSPFTLGDVDVGVDNVSVTGFGLCDPGSNPLVEITFHCDASGISDLWFDYVKIYEVDFTSHDLPWQGAIVQQLYFEAPMFWKANFTDYAPSGMPDFDQRQWGAYNWTIWGTWSHCGPVAVANSLWWYDSAYETNTVPPPTMIDNFPLVGNYGPWDDHDPKNVQPLVEHLAYLMDTDGKRTVSLHLGTNVTDMETGLAQYLSWAGNGTINPQGDVNGDGTVDQADWDIVNAAMGSSVGDGVVVSWNMAADIWPVTTGWPNQTMADNQVDSNDLNLVTANMNKTGMFYEHTVPMPDFFLIEEEVERSQDVVIILGFYVETGPDEYHREDYPYPYGHAVTVAGINSTTMQIAISDPAVDAFEQGLAPGRSPVLHMHMPPEPPYITHNNASLVSHDIYNVVFNPVMGMWEVLGYAGYPTPPWRVLIENAVITSPLVHDVAVVDVSSLYPQVDQGQVDPINVTVENQGDVPETVDVYAFYDGNLAAPKQTVPLDPGQNVTLTFNWNTTGVSLGTYTISANATIPIDDDPSDNTATGNVQEVIPEFPQAMILLLFMTLSLTIVVLKCKKKKQ